MLSRLHDLCLLNCLTNRFRLGKPVWERCVFIRLTFESRESVVVLYNTFTEKIAMAERQSLDQQLALDSQSPSASKEDMIACVMALEAALLPCLPARELQAIDRSPHPSHQIDVERHARDFMEAAKNLQLYFISLQRDDQPTRAETLRKEIAMMEEELRLKNELINQQERLIQGWRKELKDQLDKHTTELERV